MNAWYGRQGFDVMLDSASDPVDSGDPADKSNQTVAHLIKLQLRFPRGAKIEQSFRSDTPLKALIQFISRHMLKENSQLHGKF